MVASVEMPLSASSSMGGTMASEDHNGIHRQDYDVNLLRTYLEMLLPVVMSTSERMLNNTMFSRAGPWKQTLESFASDPSIVVLYVNKVRAEEAQDTTDDDSMYHYTLATQATYTPLFVSSIALIKRVPMLDSNRSLPSQLHLLSLFGPAGTSTSALSMTREGAENGNVALSIRESPYEALHSVVHNVMAPWFDAYVMSKEGKERAVTSVKSKEADTKMGKSLLVR